MKLKSDLNGGIEIPQKFANYLKNFIEKGKPLQQQSDKIYDTDTSNKLNNSNMKKLETLSDIELIKHYSHITALLRERNIIKGHNTLGDIGKRYVFDFYKSAPHLPDLVEVEGLKNINAIDQDGNRYCVQSTRQVLIGLFYGLNAPDSPKPETQKFEYVIIVIMDQDFALEKILKLSWSKFLELKRWNKANKAWNIPINKRLMKNAEIMYEK